MDLIREIFLQSRKVPLKFCSFVSFQSEDSKVLHSESQKKKGRSSFPFFCLEKRRRRGSFESLWKHWNGTLRNRSLARSPAWRCWFQYPKPNWVALFVTSRGREARSWRDVLLLLNPPHLHFTTTRCVWALS